MNPFKSNFYIRYTGHVKIPLVFLEVSLTVGPTHHWSLLGFRHWDGKTGISNGMIV